jgi:V8-like Glu-specific endopeptidase
MFDEKTLLDKVCTLALKQANGGRIGGQGVLIMPDIVLTAWHILEDVPLDQIRIEHASGKTASIVRSKFNRNHPGLDLATVEISRPLCKSSFEFAKDESAMNDGWLVTNYTGDATIHKAALDFRMAAFDAEYLYPQKRTFISDIITRAGYSGSPVFDSRGRLSSVVSGAVSNIIQDSGVRVNGHDPYQFAGASPSRLGWFVRQVLDI